MVVVLVRTMDLSDILKLVGDEFMNGVSLTDFVTSVIRLGQTNDVRTD